MEYAEATSAFPRLLKFFSDRFLLNIVRRVLSAEMISFVHPLWCSVGSITLTLLLIAKRGWGVSKGSESANKSQSLVLWWWVLADCSNSEYLRAYLPLADKYRSQLASNADEQEWYPYGSIRSEIWKSESAELIGQLVKSQVRAIIKRISSNIKMVRYMEISCLTYLDYWIGCWRWMKRSPRRLWRIMK